MRSARALAWIFLGVFAAAANASQAFPDPGALLERMREAAASVNYQGDFIFVRGDTLEAMSVSQRVDSDAERERLYSLSGAPREIVRDDEKVTCILPKGQTALINARDIENPLAEFIPQDAGQLHAHYHLITEGEGRVADRPVWVVSILPRDTLRYGYRYWIDQDHALMLRSQLLDENSEAIEQVMFTRIVFQTPDMSAVQRSTAEGPSFTWYVNDEPTENIDGGDGGEVLWEASRLPAGFSMTRRGMMPISGHPPVAHLMFSDGLARVSVYIDNVPQGKQAFAGYSSMGAVNAYGKAVEGYQVTVVGEVPAQTVATIANAIRQVGND